MTFQPSPLGRDIGGGVRSYHNSTKLGRLVESSQETLDSVGVDDMWLTRLAENAITHVIAEMEVFQLGTGLPLSFDDAISFLRARAAGVGE
jgi:hypothetical protein